MTVMIRMIEITDKLNIHRIEDEKSRRKEQEAEELQCIEGDEIRDREWQQDREDNKESDEKRRVKN